jgi:hypothetical protein
METTTTTIHINIDMDIKKIGWSIKATELEEKVICA